MRSRRTHTSTMGHGSSSSLSSQHTHTYFCHGTWFILFFISSTYPPPFAKLRVSVSLLPLTPIPAMLTAQACNRLHVFVAGSLTPQALGQHCIRRGMGVKYRLTLSFAKGWGHLEYNLDFTRLPPRDECQLCYKLN